MKQKCCCIICGRKYSYITNNTAGHTLQKCNSCSVNIRRFRLKVKCVDYKGGKCSRCGYNRCIKALTFHHRIPSDKKFSISGAHSRSWSAIKKELDKCDLLCFNCHMEIEDEILSHR